MAKNFLERYCESTTVHGFKYLVGKQTNSQKIFWAAMIIFSIGCTLRLMISLHEQITKTPIIIYREDASIDITKIPFPAFTVCEVGNLSYTERAIEFLWLRDYHFETFVMLTEVGFCNTVNFCEGKDFLRDNVDLNRTIRYTPLRSSLVSFPPNQTLPYKTTSLELGINARIQKKKYERKRRPGGENPFVLMIHSPYELPTNQTQQYYMSDMDYDAFYVTPQLNKIDETLIGMKPHERNCFLTHEKNLTLYKVYNEVNCIAECKSNFLVEQCGCVPELLIANSSVSICDSTSAACVDEAYLKFQAEGRKKCDCLPPCEHLQYIVRKIQADFTDTHPEYKSFGIPMAYAIIRFESGEHFPIVRRKQFTTTEILAFAGGLLGLFLGISVITFAEVANVMLHPLFTKLSVTICARKRRPRLNAKGNKPVKVFTRMRSYFSFYLNESSIHSFNFIASAGNYFERGFWFSTFSLSMTGCVFMILQLYQTMDFKAVTVITDDRVVDYSEIPFPAITLFSSFPSIYKLRYPWLESIYDFDLVHFIFYYNYWTPDFSEYKDVERPTTRIAAISLVSGSTYYIPFNNYLNYTDHEKYIVEEIKDFSEVEWFKENEGSFGKIFSAPFAEVLTRRGMAFSFNILNFDDILDNETVSSDFRYDRNVTLLGDHLKTKEDKFPWHASVSDSLDLEIFVELESMTEFADAFVVHPTDELPIKPLDEEFFEYVGGNSLEILIKPIVIRSEDSLKALEPSDRSCYFKGERKLKFYKIYTKKNCIYECMSAFMKEDCGCVPFQYIRDQETKVCGIGPIDNGCYYRSDKEFRDFQSNGKLAACSCLPLCESVSYNIEIRESKLLQNEFGNVTHFSFKYADEDIHPLVRTRRFTVIDFLSYSGGVLGLFAGISVLSFFELLYFFTLRVISNFMSSKRVSKHAIVIVKPAN